MLRVCGAARSRAQQVQASFCRSILPILNDPASCAKQENLEVQRDLESYGNMDWNRAATSHDVRAGAGWLGREVRGYAASAAAVDEPDSAEAFYLRATELLREVEDAAETTGQRVEDTDELRGKLEEAAECLEISLGEGRSDPRALFALSQLHEKYDLQGFSADRALSLLNHAAEAGSAEAQYELASRLRLQDEEVDPGGGRSQQLLQDAAAQGHTDAMFLLGAAELSAQAEGGPGAAVVQAKQWFKRAADLGHVPAASIYGVLLLKDPASSQGAETYLKYAAEQGEALAAEWLASIDTS